VCSPQQILGAFTHHWIVKVAGILFVTVVTVIYGTLGLINPFHFNGSPFFYFPLMVLMLYFYIPMAGLNN
jgi:hypothetical protein